MLVSTCCIAWTAASADGVIFSKLRPAEFGPPLELPVALPPLVRAITCCWGWSGGRTSRGWNWGRREEGGVGEVEKEEVSGSKSEEC